MRIITKQEYTDAVTPFWTQEAQAACKDLKNAILSNPCIQRFDHRKLIVLRTDFSSLGFGFVLLQPGNDTASTKAADNYRAGKCFSFITKGSTAVLHPVCFGARYTRGNEVWLHSHLGEGFSGDYAINKCRHYLFGQRFVWVTNCYAIKFNSSYEGGNPVILCLQMQMRLMCWDVDIVHRPDTELVDANYWSRLGVDLDFSPLFWEYIQFTQQLKKSHPPPTNIPMRPEYMPYYRGPRIQQPMTDAHAADNLHAGSLLTELITSNGCGPTQFSNIPICFWFMELSAQATSSPRVLLNSKFARYAREATQFNWAVYAFSNGQFISSIESRQLPFTISLVCDTTEQGRSLFHKFAPNAKVFSSGNDFLHHIRASNEQAIVNGYLINSYSFRTSEVTSSFWKQQLSIIAQLRLIQSLSV